MIKTILNKPWLAFSYTLLVLILCIWPGDELPETVGLYDKWSHFIAFAGVAFFWLWWRPKFLGVILLAILFGLIIEIIQGILPESFHRSFDWYDWLADSIGALIGLPVYLLSKRILE
ncbi:VanZ family protein [Jiulongibacter sediminis]|uniref:VanZ-like domain-containing protein n=1 Tax=Jiulongibacter sediminis TaxID=1605367 RepID=A0A0N8H9E3_9BACT|nr:VanZ family protein [Jiulongibacter sediminis]KPM47132.1 hypothetical protein AFM12_15025 [Jiulongibacter sediminis]TBX22693.1 hypothetical protein TK44_15035 [Jiulongibacter sediminis]